MSLTVRAFARFDGLTASRSVYQFQPEPVCTEFTMPALQVEEEEEPAPEPEPEPEPEPSPTEETEPTTTEPEPTGEEPTAEPTPTPTDEPLLTQEESQLVGIAFIALLVLAALAGLRG